MPNIKTPTDALFSCLLLAIITPLELQAGQYVKKAKKLAVNFEDEEIEQIKNLIQLALTLVPTSLDDEQIFKKNIVKRI